MSAPSSRLAQRLALLFALQTIGFLALVWRQGTPLGTTVFMAGLLSDDTSAWLDRTVAVSVAVGAICLLSGQRRLAIGGGLWAAACMAAVSIVDAWQGGHFAASLAPAAHAVRWATPAVASAVWMGVSVGSARVGLSWAAGAVFVAHGIECLLGHPTFVDFLITIPDRLIGLSIDQPAAATVLLVIGFVDVAVGVSMVALGGGAVAVWMVFWGFLTAIVRVLYFGEAGWPDALIRVTNGGVPLLILASRPWSLLGR